MADGDKIAIAERMIAAGKTEAKIEVSNREMWLVLNPKYEEFDTFQTFIAGGKKVALGLKKPSLD